MDWDRRFLQLAQFVSRWSKDPSTQVGAVIVRPDRTIASVGFNGFPKGVSDDPALYADREVKLERIVHAEINALIHANEPVKGYTLYTWPLPPCMRCTTQILQAGIERVVAYNRLETNSKWASSNEDAWNLHEEAGIELVWISDLNERN